MKVLVYYGPRDVGVSEMPDAKIEHPINEKKAIFTAV